MPIAPDSAVTTCEVRWLGLPVYRREWDARRGGVLRRYAGGLVYSVQKGPNLRVHVLGVQVYSRAWLRRKCLIFRWSRVGAWLRWLDSCLPQEYDDVYLFRHHIGETCVELMHFRERVAAMGSQKPLAVARNAAYKELLDMYLPGEVAACCVPMNVEEVFDALGEHDARSGDVAVRVGRRRFICSTPRVVQEMRRLLPTEPQLHFYTYMTHSVGIQPGAPCATPRVPTEAQQAAARRLRELRLCAGDYVLLAPEAATMEQLPVEFWRKLAAALRARGWVALVNAASPLQGECCIYPSPGELYALAQMARGVICMGSGLAVLLATAGVSMDVLFTPFADKKAGYDAALAMQVYSLRRLPGVHPDICEYNAAEGAAGEVLRRIVARYPER